MSLESFLVENGVPHRIKGEWIQFTCPWLCGDDEMHGAFSSVGACTCFKCGEKNTVKTLMKLTGRSLSDCKRALNVKHEVVESVVTKLVYPTGLCDLMKCHIDYLHGRGITDETIADYGLRGTNAISTIPWSIFIPVREYGVDVAWTCRSIVKDSKLRYLSSNTGKNIKDTLFGWDFKKPKAIVVEGPFDAMRVGKGCVALYGKDATETQIKALQTRAAVFVCLDRGEDKASLKINRRLFPTPCHNVRLNAKDAGEASEDELNELRALLD
jgi:DNA primase